MLTETRQDKILQMLEEKGSVTVQELTGKFRASESTIRRDLNALHKKGALVKVFGGAVQVQSRFCHEGRKGGPSKRTEQRSEDMYCQICGLTDRSGRFVYLDAGTTTGYMIPLFRKDR